MARQKRQSIHYVNNAQFSQAVVDYCTIVEGAKILAPSTIVQ